MTITTAKPRCQSPSRPVTGGFTLTELLIAMAIFVVVMAMAVPVFRTLTGSRSVEQATNIISATLGGVRNAAIKLQRYRGVMFYLDPNTGRIGMATLGQVDIAPAGTWFNEMAANIALDMDMDVEPVLLPPGIGLETIINGTVTAGVRASNGYIGFNASGALANKLPMGGLIMFDPDGRLSLEPAGMALLDSITSTKTALGRSLFPTSLPAWNYVSYGSSQLGFVLFESDPFLSQFGGDSAWADNNVAAQYNRIEKPKEDWLDAQATPFLVNRYNGTLIEGE